MSRWRFLPEGSDGLGSDERLLWQGRPTTAGLARNLLHLRAVVGYFVVLAGWNLVTAHHDNLRAVDALLGLAWTAVPALAVIALVYGAAWAVAATTHYLVTDRRIVLRIGVALPIALTVPLRSIGSADLKLHDDGTGDIALAFVGEDRLAFLLLWPHARPRRYRTAEPMLRDIPHAREVAGIIARALVAVAPAGSIAPAIGVVGADAPSRPAVATA